MATRSALDSCESQTMLLASAALATLAAFVWTLLELFSVKTQIEGLDRTGILLAWIAPVALWITWWLVR